MKIINVRFCFCWKKYAWCGPKLNFKYLIWLTQQNWFGFFYNFFWCFRQLYWNFFPRHFTLLYYLDSNHWSIQFSNKQSIYRKVASSRPVYYSIFDYFWGATNWDVLLTKTCYYYHVQQSIKRWVKKGGMNLFQYLQIT